MEEPDITMPSAPRNVLYGLALLLWCSIPALALFQENKVGETSVLPLMQVGSNGVLLYALVDRLKAMDKVRAASNERFLRLFNLVEGVLTEHTKAYRDLTVAIERNMNALK